MCKEEMDAGRLPQSSSQHMGSPPRQSHHYFFPLRRAKQSSIDSIPEGTNALFVSGLCRWPGCDAVSEDFPSFLKHLHSEHSHGDRSIAQWKVQQDIVQCMESQLILEKQKLIAMQLHLHLSEHKYSDLAASEWPYSLPLFLPQPAVTDADGVQQCSIKHLEELSEHGYRAAASAHLLPDLVPSIECYKYNNIRPPYTYAYLIRWNAVRHNLSLHKCFVRVEGGKGAVWTVDETEYQRRKGQKYHSPGVTDGEPAADRPELCGYRRRRMADEAPFQFLHNEVIQYIYKSADSGETENGRNISRLENMGFRVGQGLIERLTKDTARFKDELDIMKFVCKDFWTCVFKKQIDNLRTNHQGIYVLQDNKFRLLGQLSAGKQYLEQAPKYLAFTCGLVRGALSNLGVKSIVTAEVSIMPACKTHITRLSSI
ncbi:Trafficking protein particle complex subunit 6B, partial [Nibea albiflora]